MQLSDITVEVRDKSLARLGMIRPEELDLELSDLHNNVGSWKLRLGSEHPLAGALRQPGSGLVVTGRDGTEIFSGPTVKQENAATADDPAGTITFEGVTDTILLADFVALPEPSNPDLDTQTLAHDIRTGPAESLMHSFVNANIGPSAPSGRRPAGLLVSHLVMGADLARGASITKSARFPVLGNLCSELAGPDNLGFRIIQRGNTLAFETYQVVDRSTEIRLDVYNNTLAGHKVAISPPGATRVLVAGQGELTERQFLELETAESVAAEADWGRRIERFVDQRNTNVVEELTRAGTEVLDEEGFATLAVQAVPMEDSAMEFGPDWYLGDRVGVVVEAQELASTVTGYVLKASKDGFRLGALIGDPVGFDPSSALSKRVGNAENRISQLERSAENNAAGVKYLDVANFNQDTPPLSYPQGESLIYVSDAFNQGWPALGFSSGSVRSVHIDGEGRVTQTYQIQTGVFNEPDFWTRSGVEGYGWTEWRKQASQYYVDSKLNERIQKATTTTIPTVGNWYRIGIVDPANGTEKASAVFTITVESSGLHAVMKVRSTYAYDDREAATLTLEEYGGYGTIPPFTRLRLVALGSTYDGVAIEVMCADTGTDQRMQLVVENEDWPNTMTTAATAGWELVNFADQGAAGTDNETLHNRGAFWLGRWMPLTLASGWTNYGSPYPWAEFQMLPGSLVKVRGLVTTSTAATNSVITTLPEGARTRHQNMYSTIASTGLGRVDVYTDGRIGRVTGANGYFSLDPITFVAEW